MITHRVCAVLVYTVALAGMVTTAACLDVPGRVSCGDGLGCPVNWQCEMATIEKEQVAVCVQPGACGNRKREGSEECDDGNLDSSDRCSSTCQLNECGNGRQDFDEQCDCGIGTIPPKDSACQGRPNSALDGYCDNKCKLHCGDGDIIGEEVCDPGASRTKYCTSLLYDFGELACSASCDAFIVDDCGVWNWRLMDTPTIETLYGIWGSSSSDVFAVGGGGTVLHYDGRSWISMLIPTGATLRAVWGSAHDKVFAVGEGGTVLYYDGESWAPMVSSTEVRLNSVWGSAPDNVFAVGDNGVVMHYDELSWTLMTTPTGAALTGIWGRGPNDVFAVGDDGTLMHYDGQNWIEQPRLIEGSLGAIWGRGPDVFVVGEEIMHRDGQTWSLVVPMAHYEWLSGVWGNGPNDVFAIGSDGTVIHYDGTAAVLMEAPTDVGLRGIWGSGSDDVFVVGDHGVVVHYSGQSKIGM